MGVQSRSADRRHRISPPRRPPEVALPQHPAFAPVKTRSAGSDEVCRSRCSRIAGSIAAGSMTVQGAAWASVTDQWPGRPCAAPPGAGPRLTASTGTRRRRTNRPGMLPFTAVKDPLEQEAQLACR
jgi:hypothetical protein